MIRTSTSTTAAVATAARFLRRRLAPAAAFALPTGTVAQRECSASSGGLRIIAANYKVRLKLSKRPTPPCSLSSSSSSSSSGYGRGASSPVRSFGTRGNVSTVDDDIQRPSAIETTARRRKWYDAEWEKNFERLKSYYEENREQLPKKKNDDGNDSTQMSASYLPAPKDETLRTWVNNQRKMYRLKMKEQQQQQQERHVMLNGEILDETDGYYDEDEGYDDDEGDSDTGDNTVVSSLTDERIARLESLGVALAPRKAYWDRMFEQLCEFKRVHDGRFPYDLHPDKLESTDDQRLMWWCQRVKRYYKEYQAERQLHRDDRLHDDDLVDSAKDHEVDDEATPSSATMTAERIAKLEAIGFAWDLKQEAWFRNFRAFSKFRDRFGHCLVPMTDKDSDHLATWVGVQRYQYKLWKEGKPCFMTQQRYEMLCEIDFVWNARDARWLERYRELKEHYELNGAYGALPSPKHDSSLRAWCIQQRKLYKRKHEDGARTSLTDERERLLEELGFPF